MLRRLFLLPLALVWGCSGDDDDHDHTADAGHTHHDDAGHSHDDAGQADAGTTLGTFRVNFAARMGAEAAACGQVYAGMGPGGNRSVEFQDFRFYVHDIHLIDHDGAAVPLTIADQSPWQGQGVALLDFEDKSGRCGNGTTETRTYVEGQAPAGHYTGIRFTLGVPFALNHADVAVAAAPLNLTALFWNWQGGYKFLRADVSADPVNAGDPRPVFNVHVGSTGCDGTPAGDVTRCDRPNRPVITLDNFDLETQVIVADYAQLLEGLDPAINTPMTAPGCMSTPADPECVEVMTSLNLDFDNTNPAPDFFSVGAR